MPLFSAGPLPKGFLLHTKPAIKKVGLIAFISQGQVPSHLYSICITCEWHHHYLLVKISLPNDVHYLRLIQSSSVKVLMGNTYPHRQWWYDSRAMTIWRAVVMNSLAWNECPQNKCIYANLTTRKKLMYKWQKFKLLLMKSWMDVAQILQGLSYEVCSTISSKFFKFRVLVVAFGVSTIIH